MAASSQAPAAQIAAALRSPFVPEVVLALARAEGVLEAVWPQLAPSVDTAGFLGSALYMADMALEAVEEGLRAGAEPAVAARRSARRGGPRAIARGARRLSLGAAAAATAVCGAGRGSRRALCGRPGPDGAAGDERTRAGAPRDRGRAGLARGRAPTGGGGAAAAPGAARALPRCRGLARLTSRRRGRSCSTWSPTRSSGSAGGGSTTTRARRRASSRSRCEPTTRRCARRA